MGKIVGIFGPSGHGKTTSLIVAPDGSYTLDPKEYKGMSPKTTFYIDFDRKALPFPNDWWKKEHENFISTSNIVDVRETLKKCSERKEIKAVVLDTLNLFLSYKEYNDRKKLVFDQWRDIANDIIEINTLCNTILRDDQVAYILGHTELVTDIDGNEMKVLSVIGKKSKRQPPESFYPIVLMTHVEYNEFGENKYFFTTKPYYSSVKTPLGMFDEFLIPNSIKYVDDKVREYYKI